MELDGSHSVAKRGGESVGYQNRKKAKTTNMLFLCTKNGYPIAISQPVSGNHHDSFELIGQMKKLLKNIKSLLNDQESVYLNADSAFYNNDFRKLLFNNGIIPNIKVVLTIKTNQLAR